MEDTSDSDRDWDDTSLPCDCCERVFEDDELIFPCEGWEHDQSEEPRVCSECADTWVWCWELLGWTKEGEVIQRGYWRIPYLLWLKSQRDK